MCAAHAVRAWCVYWGDFIRPTHLFDSEMHVFPSYKRYSHCTYCTVSPYSFTHVSFMASTGHHWRSGTHRARTVHLFYLDNIPDAIVLPCCCPVRRRVAELVPHFTLCALRTALYMLSLGL